VKVFHTGELDNLGDNLRNVLRNNFTHIEKFFSNTQQDKRLVLPSSVRGEPVEPSFSVRGEPVEPQSPFDRLRANPPSWRMVLKKIAGGVTGGILGALLGGISFGLLAAGVADMENSILLESQISIGAFALAWIVLATLSGIRKGSQKYQSLAWAAIPLILILLLAAIVIPNLLTAVSRSKRPRTTADMRAIGTALGSYQVDSNYFPNTSGIKIQMSDKKGNIGKTLCDEEYYCGALRDSWGQPFSYISNGTSYTLTSYGKDRKPGGKSEYGSDIIYVDGQFTAPSALVYK
jgi:type II secretion system protein G